MQRMEVKMVEFNGMMMLIIQNLYPENLQYFNVKEEKMLMILMNLIVKKN